jgi:asparagine synthase (glutamine-hydrolysing)
MVAISGVCSLDGAPASPAALESMNDAARFLTGSTPTMKRAGPAGLASHAGPDDASCHDDWLGRPPLRLLAVADLRLDNRRELVRELSHHEGSEADSDLRLVLKAFAAFGTSSFGRIVGDFSLAIWDEARQRLVCACDPLGIKTLYVRVGPTRVAFATQLPQLLAVSDDVPRLSLEFVADQLANGVPRANAAQTPYLGVTRLLPGHALIVERGSARIERYWDWQVAPRIRYADRDEYARHFRSLFTDSVRACLRTSGSVWADLSGGLDSSSIVCVAGELHARNGSTRPLSTVSIEFKEAAVSDERVWADSVRRKYSLAAHAVDGDVHHPFSSLMESVGYWDEPQTAIAFAGMHRRYLELLQSNGGTVLLSGAGAEAVVMGKAQGPVHFADLFAGLRWLTLGRELKAWQRARRVPFSNLLFQYAVRPWWRPRLVGYGWQRSVHAWMEPAFDRRMGLRERARHGSMPDRFASPADQLHYEQVGRVTGFLQRGYLEKFCDIRYPYLSRPLVDFMLRTPWHVKIDPDECKPVLRRAMAGLLPDDVRQRKIASSFGHAVYLGIRKEWPLIERLIRASRLADLGCVSPARLLDAANLARCGHAADLHGLVTTLSLEAWLQGAFAQPAARPPLPYGATAGPPVETPSRELLFA